MSLKSSFYFLLEEVFRDVGNSRTNGGVETLRPVTGILVLLFNGKLSDLFIVGLNNAANAADEALERNL